jgi:Pyruvate/2-oxoacid:ferredoxin oxidoreductase delta subunit
MIGNGSPRLFKSENEYIRRINKFTDKVLMATKDSDQEGFEYFRTEEYRKNPNSIDPSLKGRLLFAGFKKIPRMFFIFARNMKTIMGGRNRCYKDLEEYLDELEQNGKLSPPENSYSKGFPNKKLWKELEDYAWSRWKVIFGFTELPIQLIFKGKGVLFKYSLVCIQEMKREKIELAPDLSAGSEVLRVYGSLGLAVNDIARWLRDKHNIRCQSNHPLGGLVNTPPLAGKAGLGWRGLDGMLITPQFGQRQRIAPIFIEDKLFEFTDNDDHLWIEEYCKSCRICEEACPPQAIYLKGKAGIQNINGINQTITSVDLLKCFPQFSKTLGCSICVKVCPFSKGGESYLKIKSSFDKKGTK